MKYLQQFVTTFLNVGGGIDASQTTGIVLQSLNNVDATKPSVACISWSDPLSTSVAEWVTYTSINSTTNELQGVTRGAEGYSAKTHSNQAVVAFPLSKSHINEVNDAVAAEHSAAGVHSVAGMISGGSVKDEDDMASNSATALATQQSIKAYVDSGAVTMTNKTLTAPVWDGWSGTTDTWTYASASTFTIAGVDRTAIFTKGTRLKFTQTTVKYAVVVNSSFSTDTTITIAVNTDYTIANAAITSPYYSYAANPQGYPSHFTYAPTLTNITIGNGSATGRYAQIGSLAFFSFNLTCGSTTSMGTNPIFTVPVLPKYSNSIVIASLLLDSGTASFFSTSVNESVGSKENVYTYVHAAGGSYATYSLITATVPFTWTTNDRLSATGTYEIA